jgi:hypothetical protein
MRERSPSLGRFGPWVSMSTIGGPLIWTQGDEVVYDFPVRQGSFTDADSAHAASMNSAGTAFWRRRQRHTPILIPVPDAGRPGLEVICARGAGPTVVSHAAFASFSLVGPQPGHAGTAILARRLLMCGRRMQLLLQQSVRPWGRRRRSWQRESGR